MGVPERPSHRSLRRSSSALCLAGVVALVGCSARVPLPAATAGATNAAPSPSASQGPVDPEDTGVPDGVALEPSEGLRITEDGAVVDGLDVDGCVTVLAEDVTIRNTRIRCADKKQQLVVRMGDGARNLVVESSEIDGRGKLQVGVGWSGYTLRKVDVHGVADGARFGHGVTVEDSWIHDMARIGTLHSDALQTTSASDVVIRGNVLDPTRTEDDDLNNAGLMLGSETGSKQVRDVLVEHNLFDGGNYSLNVRGDIDAEGVVIRDNVFGDASRYGAVLTPRSVPLGDGNVMAGSGEPVEADRAGS